ncbi:DNA repair protein RAD51 homolog 4-like isoform X2 [Paramacrobiotus metropolitanus]|uniref:DNA repair protein RAD51 homolog 4-like isoform X2 n=1 Tax=Paramacrobiotus metropolitanus TaxID=2943436 RepID=UPI002445CA65|nr:DNA repair protein RAD51 homolog 4-like isoform X2 [Paramacrobiotus metropolitanus]
MPPAGGCTWGGPLLCFEGTRTENIQNKLKNKLITAGYGTLADLLEASPEVISEKTAISIMVIRVWQAKLRALVHHPYTSALDLYPKELHDAFICPIGLPSLENIFSQLLRRSEIMEICGGPLSGKTQFCLHIALNAVRTSSRKVLYIDTVGQLSARRLKKMCKSLGDLPNRFMNLLECIYTVQIADIYGLFQFLDFLPHWKGSFLGAEDELFISDQPDIIIIDSLFAILAPFVGSKVDQGYGYNLINEMAFTLKNIASEMGVLVISVPHHRIGLESDDKASNEKFGNGDVRRCKVIRGVLMKSTTLAVGTEIVFLITEQGLSDMPGAEDDSVVMELSQEV